MDKTRKLVQDLLQIQKFNNKDESLEKKHLWGDILEDECKELKKGLNLDTVSGILSKRIYLNQ